MSNASLSDVLFSSSATPSIQSLLGLGHDLGARRSLRPRAASALAAPVAMLVGAVGLLGLWTAMPRDQAASASVAFEPSAAPAAHQPPAVTQTAVRDEQTLSQLLIDLGAPGLLTPAPTVKLTTTAAQTVAELRQMEAGLVSAAEASAQTRLQSLGATFRTTGLDVRPYLIETGAPVGLSRLELRDARVLAVRLDIDPGLARQVQRTARDLTAAHALGEAAAALPLATPVDNPVRSSPFGTRIDPFTGVSSFHPGQDFSGHYGDAIHATAPGVVSFTGQRTGYGNCVEVDHGHGFKTRYGHLEAIEAGVGEAVKTGDLIGRMGSTGRSTGVHLHYEVWVSGRPLDPAPFLKAGMPALRS